MEYGVLGNMRRSSKEKVMESKIRRSSGGGERSVLSQDVPTLAREDRNRSVHSQC